MRILILSTLSILHLIRPSTAISCYICQSRSNADCGDPIKLSKLELTECTSSILRASRDELAHALSGFVGLSPYEASDLIVGTNIEESAKECQKISFTLRDQQVTVRGCHAVGNRWPESKTDICRLLEEKARHSTYQQETYLYYCDTCESDGCNSAPMQRTPSTWLTIVLTAITVLVVAAMAR